MFFSRTFDLRFYTEKHYEKIELCTQRQGECTQRGGSRTQPQKGRAHGRGRLYTTSSRAQRFKLPLIHRGHYISPKRKDGAAVARSTDWRQGAINIKAVMCREEPDENGGDKQQLYRWASIDLRQAGCSVAFAAGAPRDLAVFDEEIVWYGDLPLLGFPHKEDCSIRFHSPEVAADLLSSASLSS